MQASFAAAKELTPGFDWNGYISGRGIKDTGDMNVTPPKFFTELNTVIKDATIDDWKTHLKWMTVNSAAPFLPKGIRR